MLGSLQKTGSSGDQQQLDPWPDLRVVRSLPVGQVAPLLRGVRAPVLEERTARGPREDHGVEARRVRDGEAPRGPRTSSPGLVAYVDLLRLVVAERRRRHRTAQSDRATVERYGEDALTVEIRGLGDAVRAARAGISDARRATAEVHESSRALVTTLGEVKKQIDAAHEDIKFEAQQLGNSPPEGEQLPQQAAAVPSSFRAAAE